MFRRFRQIHFPVVGAVVVMVGLMWVVYASGASRLWIALAGTLFVLAASLLFALAVKTHGTHNPTSLDGQSGPFSYHARYERFVRNSATMIWEIDAEGTFTYLSPNARQLIGYRPDEVVGSMKAWDFHPRGGDSHIKRFLLDAMEEERAFTSLENPLAAKDGRIIWVLSAGMPLYNAQGLLIGYQGWDMDITRQKRSERRLQESEAKYRRLFENMQEGVSINELVYDENGNLVNYRITEANPAYERIFGVTLEEIEGKLADEAFQLEKPPFFDVHRRVAETHEPESFEWYFSALDQTFRLSVFPHRKDALATLYTDVSREKDIKETIDALSYRDKLTKLHNRRYYEESIPFVTRRGKLPLSIILCDMNALKIANDAFGHQVGDEILVETARILSSYAREQDVLARIGGDEFILLMPNTTREKAKRIMLDVKQASRKQNVQGVDLSLSFGLAVMHSVDEDFDVVYRRAESALYRYKLNEGPRVRMRMLDTIERTLETSYSFEKDHGRNTKFYALELGKALGLSDQELQKLEYAARYHDIGKVALPRDTLSRKGPLREGEWLDVVRHSEIGYRILTSIPSLADIGEYVLSHHENFDGSGYPQGLKGETIPLISRILRIVDSFDAMTSPRSYQKTHSEAEALAELKAKTGTLYDPELVDRFVETRRDEASS